MATFAVLLDAECDIVAHSQGQWGGFAEAARQGPLTTSAIWPQPEAAKNHQPPSDYRSQNPSIHFTPCNGASDGEGAWANSYDSEARLLLHNRSFPALSLGHRGQAQLTEYICVATGKTRESRYEQGRAGTFLGDNRFVN